MGSCVSCGIWEPDLMIEWLVGQMLGFQPLETSLGKNCGWVQILSRRIFGCVNSISTSDRILMPLHSFVLCLVTP